MEETTLASWKTKSVLTKQNQHRGYEPHLELTLFHSINIESTSMSETIAQNVVRCKKTHLLGKKRQTLLFLCDATPTKPASHSVCERGHHLGHQLHDSLDGDG